jgi:hypothetical protein
MLLSQERSFAEMLLSQERSFAEMLVQRRDPDFRRDDSAPREILRNFSP